MAEVINTIGRRKTAVARIYMTPGNGTITVNKKDYKEFRAKQKYYEKYQLPQPREILQESDELGKKWLTLRDIKTVKQIMDGDFKVPTTKKLERTAAPVSDFAVLNDSDDSLPF